MHTDPPPNPIRAAAKKPTFSGGAVHSVDVGAVDGPAIGRTHPATHPKLRSSTAPRAARIGCADEQTLPTGESECAPSALGRAGIGMGRLLRESHRATGRAPRRWPDRLHASFDPPSCPHRTGSTSASSFSDATVNGRNDAPSTNGTNSSASVISRARARAPASSLMKVTGMPDSSRSMATSSMSALVNTVCPAAS